MRVLVTGSRSWDDNPGCLSYGIVEWALTLLNEDITLRVVVDGELPYSEVITLVHGGCPDSPDMLADAAARKLGWQVETHKADWLTHGKQAGFIRNREMIDLGADVCLAFMAPCDKPNCLTPKPHDSHGASHCAWFAEAAGIRVLRYCQ